MYPPDPSRDPQAAAPPRHDGRWSRVLARRRRRRLLRSSAPSMRPTAASTDFDDVVGILALLASVVGVIVGATAGGADIESGVFRDLVATGRSRTRAVLRPRARRAGRSSLPHAAAAIGSRSSGRAARRHGPRRRRRSAAASPRCSPPARSTAAVVRRPRRADRLARPRDRASRWPSSSASRRCSAQIEALGDARLAIPQVAIARIGGADGLRGSPPRAAIAILLAWAAVALGGGALAHPHPGDLGSPPWRRAARLGGDPCFAGAIVALPRDHRRSPLRSR